MVASPFAYPEDLGAYLKQTIADDDATALLYLETASDVVRDYLQQQIDYVPDDVVILDPEADGTVFLPELPVVSVSKVETFDGGVWADADPATYTVSNRTGVVTARRGYGTLWPRGAGSWRITYTHGFAEVPGSLKSATLGVAARAYATEVGVDSERIGGYQVKYAIESAGFSPVELAALNRFRVARVA